MSTNTTIPLTSTTTTPTVAETFAVLLQASDISTGLSTWFILALAGMLFARKQITFLLVTLTLAGVLKVSVEAGRPYVPTEWTTFLTFFSLFSVTIYEYIPSNIPKQYLLLALYIHTFTTYLLLSNRITLWLPLTLPLPLLATTLYHAVIQSTIIASLPTKETPLSPDQSFQVWQSHIPSRWASAILYGTAGCLFIYVLVRMEQIKMNIGGRKRIVGCVGGVVVLAGVVEVADGVVRIVCGRGVYEGLVAGGFGVIICVQGLVKSQSYLLIALSLFMTSPVITLIGKAPPTTSTPNGSDLDPTYSTTKQFDYNDAYSTSSGRKVHFDGNDDNHSVLTLEPLPGGGKDEKRGMHAGPHSSASDILYPAQAWTSGKSGDAGYTSSRAALTKNVADISTDDDERGNNGWGRSRDTTTTTTTTTGGGGAAPLLAMYAGIGSSNSGSATGSTPAMVSTSHSRNQSLGAMGGGGTSKSGPTTTTTTTPTSNTKYPAVNDSYGYDAVRPGYASTIDTASIAESSYTNTTTDTRDRYNGGGGYSGGGAVRGGASTSKGGGFSGNTGMGRTYGGGMRTRGDWANAGNGGGRSGGGGGGGGGGAGNKEYIRPDSIWSSLK
ncbi:hypothetical protein HDV00_002300 [Rhizophlyctis rosea]|nr:hypothetical protein HDV00_002300 [Rhizophlyctis rosea]